MDDRLVKSGSESRNTRVENTRIDADSAMATSKERRKMFREFTQEALPTPPETPGWHYCWLSMTNQYDPIYKRMRLGYEPVKADELPEFNHLRVKSGEYENSITVNEMILFKIPQEIYQEIMEENHHYRPLEEEERVRTNAKPQGKDSQGADLGIVEGDGYGSSNRSRVPTFN
jgi:hypothetical protein